MSFHPEQLSPTTWKVVEEDRFGQFPFLYIIKGKSRTVVIDTGCGRPNFFSLVLTKSSGSHSAQREGSCHFFLKIPPPPPPPLTFFSPFSSSSILLPFSLLPLLVALSTFQDLLLSVLFLPLPFLLLSSALSLTLSFPFIFPLLFLPSFPPLFPLVCVSSFCYLPY